LLKVNCRDLEQSSASGFDLGCVKTANSGLGRLVRRRDSPNDKRRRGGLKTAKPAKIALTAIMRKLLVIANALLRDRRKWNENPA
jgi:hypothetical protein